MDQSISQKRPWLAALLTALATGFGHFYLRRWKRAVGWVALTFSATVLFVDSATLDALANSNAVSPVSIAPTLIVGGFSVVDAYLLAYAHNASVRPTANSDEQPSNCPHCGKELDTEFEFCPWCAADIEQAGSTPSWDWSG